MEQIISRFINWKWPPGISNSIMIGDNVDLVLKQLTEIPDHIMRNGSLSLIRLERDLRITAILKIIRRYYEVEVEII